jgi:hypothetical protein
MVIVHHKTSCLWRTEIKDPETKVVIRAAIAVKVATAVWGTKVALPNLQALLTKAAAVADNKVRAAWVHQEKAEAETAARILRGKAVQEAVVTFKQCLLNVMAFLMEGFFVHTP